MALQTLRRMLAECGGRAGRLQVTWLALLAACATPPPALEPGAAPQVPAVAAPVVAVSEAKTVADYRRQVAELLHAANLKGLYPGVPPNPLRAVIVVYIEVDPAGVLRRLELFRAPSDTPELVDEVERAWRRLGRQLPRPQPHLMNGGERLAFTQTWLFDFEGRFRLSTLSEQQVAPWEAETFY
jgi:hypothetical protein